MPKSNRGRHEIDFHNTHRQGATRDDGLPDQRSQWHLVILLALAGLILFPSLTKGGLSGYDDALYAHEAKQMVRTGDYWNVEFNGYPNFEYPPMFLWLEAASMKLLGVNDYAAKFPAALAGFGTILTLYFLTRELTGDVWVSAIAVFVLTTTQPFMKYAMHAMTDVPFTFLVTLGLFFYLKGLRQPAYCLAAGVPIGCAMLTRSIMGAAPLGIIAMHLILTRRYRMLLSPHVLGGFFVALLLPLVWFGVQYKLHGDHFFTSHLAFISTKIVGTDNSWAPALNVITYAEALLKYYWPWLPLMAAGFAVQAWAAVRDRSSSSIFLVVWILLVILPLSLVETKYGRYLMPIFPALAIVSALSVRRWLPPRRRHAVFMSACVILALVAAFTILFPAKERGLDMRKLAPIAESNSRSDERILIYTYGEAGYDYQNQFLWYANRHSDLITDLDHLRTQLRQRTVATGIIDKPSFDQLMGQLEPSVARYIEVLAASESFICFRFNRTAGWPDRKFQGRAPGAGEERNRGPIDVDVH